MGCWPWSRSSRSRSQKIIDKKYRKLMPASLVSGRKPKKLRPNMTRISPVVAKN